MSVTCSSFGRIAAILVGEIGSLVRVHFRISRMPELPFSGHRQGGENSSFFSNCFFSAGQISYLYVVATAMPESEPCTPLSFCSEPYSREILREISRRYEKSSRGTYGASGTMVNYSGVPWTIPGDVWMRARPTEHLEYSQAPQAPAQSTRNLANFPDKLNTQHFSRRIILNIRITSSTHFWCSCFSHTRDRITQCRLNGFQVNLVPHNIIKLVRSTLAGSAAIRDTMMARSSGGHNIISKL